MHPVKIFVLLSIVAFTPLALGEEKQERAGDEDVKAYMESVREVQRLQRDLAYAKKILDLRIENMKLKYKLLDGDQLMPDGRIIRKETPPKKAKEAPKKE